LPPELLKVALDFGKVLLHFANLTRLMIEATFHGSQPGLQPTNVKRQNIEAGIKFHVIYRV
jgi:hypothetical protein